MQQDRELVRTNTNNITFFRPHQSNVSISSSTFFNFFRFLSFMTLLDVVSGNNPPNPFTFIAGACYYFLSTSASSMWDNYAPYASIVNNLVTNVTGPITQTTDYIPAANTLWKVDICGTYSTLQSNCNQTSAVPFVNNFIAMANNDSFVQAAKAACGKGSTIAIWVVVGVCVAPAIILALYGLAKAAQAGCNALRRSGYDDINDDGDQTLTRVATP
jgi:hypothetical protein